MQSATIMQSARKNLANPGPKELVPNHSRIISRCNSIIKQYFINQFTPEEPSTLFVEIDVYLEATEFVTLFSKGRSFSS